MKVLSLVVLFVIAVSISAAIVSAAAKGGWRGGFSFSAQPETDITMPKTKKPMYSKSGYNVQHLSKGRIEELSKKLKPDEVNVILAKGTEPAFCGNLTDNHKDGVYVCRLCGLPLFPSNNKFDSGTGWPSFFKPYDLDHVDYDRDSTHGMTRTEILCTRCGAHLGHVFEDGPKPTGLRYCVNSVSLEFVEQGKDGKIPWPEASKPLATQTAYFAGGCFWGVEDRLQQVPGVIDAVSGYQAGKGKDPTYEQVCSHTTGFAETVKVVFDPAKVSYKELLGWFFKIHDPTQLNRQGPDVGDNYRSAIYADNDEQLAQAKAFIEEQSKSERFKGRKIVTQLAKVADVGPFYAAEDYHQDYHEKHGGSCPLPND